MQYDFEMHVEAEHRQWMTLNKFWLDKFPATCAQLQYKRNLNASGYRPKGTANWLRNWLYNESTDTYDYPQCYDKKPVTFVGLSEARLFCAWNGKWLPYSYELQYASRGNTSCVFPWGNEATQGRHYPQSESVFGVCDLVGNVWHFTDEFRDEHTRYAVLRGSCNYHLEVTLETG